MPIQQLRIESGKRKVNQTLSKNSKPKNGFSLIDILLASFLLIVFITILLIGSGTFLTTRRYSLQNVSAQIASDRIDYLRNLAKTNWPGFVNLIVLSTAPPTIYNSSQIPELSKLPPGATLEQKIFTYSANQDLKQTLIKVNWTEKGITRSTKFETLIYQHGLN